MKANTIFHFYSKLFYSAAKQFMECQGSIQAAALSFYSMFSIGPVLFLSLFITSFFFDANEVKKVIIENSGNYLGNESQKFFQNILEHHKIFNINTPGFYVSLLFVLISCLTIFDALQRIFSVIFHFKVEEAHLVKDFIRFRVRSILGSLIVGITLLMFLLVSSFIGFIFSIIPSNILNFFGVAAYLPLVVPFLMFSTCISFLFKYLPRRSPSWKACIIGACFTSVAFHFTKSLAGFYLRNQGLQSVYSISGSVIVFLLWVFISAQILILGAHFTNEFAKVERKKWEQ